MDRAKYSSLAAAEMLAVVARACDGGRLQIFSGKRPDNPNADAVHDALVSFELSSPAFTLSERGAELIAPAPQLVVLDGAPTWARILDANGCSLIDMSAGTEDADLIVSPAHFEKNEMATVGSFRYSLED